MEFDLEEEIQGNRQGGLEEEIDIDRDEREKVNQFTVRDAYKVLNVSLYDS